jgi:hypothetical protein
LFSATSGFKQDRNLGRKFESGASKRKREAELERKNLELSTSLLKFLERNDDESVTVIVQRKLREGNPNVFILLRIIMSVPVTTASAERSFSRLKLIKTYLRTKMAQERLTGLAILSIENEVASALDNSEILGSFSSRKSRERYF